jgi:carbonic anhydrase
MDSLHKEGYSTFLKDYFANNKALFDTLSQGQSPDTLLITCSDSRINPALLLNAEPGELFIVRNIGNAVPHYQPDKGSTQAAIEYAISVLHVQKVVILGHSNCGACAHLYHEHQEGDPDLPHVDAWLKYLEPAKNAAMLSVHADPSKNIFEMTEKHNVVISLRRLMEYHEVQERLVKEELKLFGWWYDIGSGKVEQYNYATNDFEPVV